MTFVSTKNLSPLMRRLAREALGGIDPGFQIPVAFLPSLISAPICIGSAHLTFEQPADQFRNRSVLVCSLSSSPVSEVFIKGNCNVLIRHELSVTREHCKSRGIVKEPGVSARLFKIGN